MQTTFRLSILQWLKDQVAGQPNESLPAFNFNEKAVPFLLYQAVQLQQGEEDGWLLSIPGFIPVQAIAAPASVVSLQFTFATACASSADAAPLGSYSTKFEIPYNDTHFAARDIPLPGFAQQDALMLVVLSIRCVGEHGAVQELRYWNSRVVGLLIN